MPLKIREKKDCRWDLVSLGEVMVRDLALYEATSQGEHPVHEFRLLIDGRPVAEYSSSSFPLIRSNARSVIARMLRSG